jgi:hypothetical protein
MRDMSTQFRRMPWWGAGLLLFLLGFVLAIPGCGGGTKTVIEKTVTEPATESGAGGGGSASSSDGGGSASSSGSSEEVPDLVGERLDVAEEELDGLGINYDEIGGGTFGIVVRSNWEVCETNPGAGESADSVKLIVDRPGNC